MAEAENKPGTEVEPLISAGGKTSGGRNWMPMIVGAVLVLVAVTLIVIFARNPSTPSHPDPYAANLQVSNLHMETAQNFAGGTVTYVEGTLMNTGDKKVTGATMQVIFKNPLGELVEEPTLPVMALQPNTPIVDYGPMEHAPIGPGQSRDFRVTLEHVSRDWNGQIPEVKVVAVSSS